MKIYTKTGDKGETGTFNGRMPKGGQVARALGTIDELNSWVGLCRNSPLTPLFDKERGTKGVSLDAQLKTIQHNLMVIGTIIAGSQKYEFSSNETKKLERLIDKLDKELPKLHNFIFPKGYLQLARSVARRCEREVVATEIKDKNVLKYLNRLSDALFVMGRWVSFKMGEMEEVWKG